ncbi:hypothetical protein AXG93_3532s1000 [Marchantia polymorpha subsp. ruderalis]|uniref:Uncharacterized protein n=1 Tax=Marchantia polymorpha subsp. ruderalis TaxID=1480154 RepID=A0A176WEH9_MARPO|nr:hypothetical protein AXG93_3532s1000 [Marchantia polymorpha subsp. ruderalis]
MAMPPKSLAAIVSKVGHANTECTATRPSYPVNAVDWIPMWELAGYYTDAVEEIDYPIQEAPAPTFIPSAHISRYAPKDMATTFSQPRMVPPCALARPPPSTCYNYGGTRHYFPNCPHPRRQMGYVPLCGNYRKLGQTAAECDQ